jgi:hypothetical protein
MEIGEYHEPELNDHLLTLSDVFDIELQRMGT